MTRAKSAHKCLVYWRQAGIVIDMVSYRTPQWHCPGQRGNDPRWPTEPYPTIACSGHCLCPTLHGHTNRHAWPQPVLSIPWVSRQFLDELLITSISDYWSQPPSILILYPANSDARPQTIHLAGFLMKLSAFNQSYCFHKLCHLQRPSRSSHSAITSSSSTIGWTRIKIG